MQAFGADRPPIVVLCGSVRFRDEFQEVNHRLTMDGAIVLSPAFRPHTMAHHEPDPAEKAALADLHKRKIDLADRVHVINVGGYIGESTRAEIAYAEAAGKPISYLDPSYLT